jgi:pilus assembly protein Flp/PilA
MIERVNKNLPRGAWKKARNCNDFIQDSRGFAAVEFGMIALPFLLLIVAILEYSFGNYAQSQLDAVVQQTSREIMTGYVQNQSVAGQPLDAGQFRSKIICPKLPALMSCNDIYVDVQAFDVPNYASFVNATKSGLTPPQLDNSKNQYCVGGAKKYVVLRAAYPTPVIATALIVPTAATYNGRKARILQSTATFKNEPFPNSNVGC